MITSFFSFCHTHKHAVDSTHTDARGHSPTDREDSAVRKVRPSLIEKVASAVRASIGLQAKRAARAPTRFASRNLQVRSRSARRTAESSRRTLLRLARTIELMRNCCARVRCADNSHTLVAKAIVIPNFKHSWACLGGAKSRRPKRP